MPQRSVLDFLVPVKARGDKGAGEAGSDAVAEERDDLPSRSRSPAALTPAAAGAVCAAGDSSTDSPQSLPSQESPGEPKQRQSPRRRKASPDSDGSRAPSPSSFSSSSSGAGDRPTPSARAVVAVTRRKSAANGNAPGVAGGGQRRTYSRRATKRNYVDDDRPAQQDGGMPACLLAEIGDYDSILGSSSADTSTSLDGNILSHLAPEGVAVSVSRRRWQEKKRHRGTLSGESAAGADSQDSVEARALKRSRGSDDGVSAAAGVPNGASVAAAPTQMYLDLGQRDFTAVRCAECGMIYNPGVPEDEADHAKTHAAIVLGSRPMVMPSGWQKFEVATFPLLGSVLMFQHANAGKLEPPVRRKLNQARDVVDQELTYACPRNGGAGPDEKYFLFVTPTGRIVGCAIAERISVAYPSQTSGSLRQTRISDVFSTTSSTQSASADREGPTAETDDADIVSFDINHPVPARCGISRIWVFHKNRRQGIATKLLDAVRSHYFYGEVVARSELAFTQPTRDGTAAFSAYTSNTRFPLYNPVID